MNVRHNECYLNDKESVRRRRKFWEKAYLALYRHSGIDTITQTCARHTDPREV